MALAFLNACIFRATSTGTGAFVPASAITGYYTPAGCANPAVVSGATYRYRAESDDRTQHEEGYGVWNGTNLARTIILSSSNSGSVVTFSAAPKVQMGGPLAQDMIPNSSESISSPVANIEIDVDVSNADVVRVWGVGFQVGTAADNEAELKIQIGPTGGSLFAAVTSLGLFGDGTLDGSASFLLDFIIDGANGVRVQGQRLGIGDGDVWDDGVVGRAIFGDVSGDMTIRIFATDSMGAINLTAGTIRAQPLPVS